MAQEAENVSFVHGQFLFYTLYIGIEYVFPWPAPAHVEDPAEQENGVKVPALPAL